MIIIITIIILIITIIIFVLIFSWSIESFYFIDIVLELILSPTSFPYEAK